VKKNLLFIGFIFLGLSFVISSYIISHSLSNTINTNAAVNGVISVSNSDNTDKNSDVLMPYDAGAMLGYQSDEFIQMIKDGKLEGIPYVDLGDHYIFSKKALEEWVYNNSTK